MDHRKMKLETTSIFSCSLFFLRRVFLFLLLPCTPVLAVEVELQLVVHDAPDVSVDKRAHTRWIHDAVATSSGTQVQIVGLDQNVWPRNIILDDDAKKPDQSKLIFERFYKGKYIEASKQNSYRWNDPKIKIKWPIRKPILSNRDKNSQLL